MSTVAVVKKDGYVAIAADTLTTYGNTKESAEYIVNSGKIVKYQDNYIGVTGSASFQIVLEDFLSKGKKKISLESVSDIFRFGILLHKELKQNYFIRPDDRDSDSFETMRGDILILNPNGIFGMSEYRYVQEYSKFYAFGSGNEYALGAMFAVYNNKNKTAEDIAQIGVQAGVEFDDGTGLPVTCYTMKIK